LQPKCLPISVGGSTRFPRMSKVRFDTGELEIVDVHGQHNSEGFMSEHSGAARNSSKTFLSQRGLAMFLPEHPRVGVAVRGEPKRHDWIFVLSDPAVRPPTPEHADPGFGTMQEGLGLGWNRVGLPPRQPGRLAIRSITLAAAMLAGADARSRNKAIILSSVSLENESTFILPVRVPLGQ
jgi:hypothetical protein